MQLGFCALILVLFSTVLSADIGFVAAYLIDDAGQRQEVEIRRRGWAYNPVQITYRLPGETKSRIAGIADVQEFGSGVDESVAGARVSGYNHFSAAVCGW